MDTAGRKPDFRGGDAPPASLSRFNRVLGMSGGVLGGAPPDEFFDTPTNK